jgi:putative lipoprotein
MRPFLAAFCLISFTWMLTGTTPADDKDNKPKVTGTIESKGEHQFDKETVAEVALQDVSRADAAAVVLAKQTIKDLKKFPIPFEIEYDPGKIDAKADCAIGVRITTKGKLDFINDTHIRAVTSGGPTKDIKVPVVKAKN